MVETLFPESEHEMVTVYHQDGDDLVLTHYCAMGNQPRMRCAPGGEPNKFVFKFHGGTNLNPDKDFFMHDAVITMPDNDKLVSEWTHYQNGKPSGTAKIELSRKKK